MNEDKSIIKRIFIGSVLGVISYLDLQSLPYFPQWWNVCFGLSIALVSYKYIKAAIVTFLVAFGIVLAFNSIPLFVLYAVTVFFITMSTMHLPYFAEAFLIIAGAPWLSSVTVYGMFIPMEFLAIFIAPMLIKKTKGIPVVVGLACLFVCLVGIIMQKKFMGAVIVGMPHYVFLPERTMPYSFYDLSWFEVRMRVLSPQSLFGTILNIMMFFISNPLIFVQAGSWSIISYYVTRIFEKKKWWLDLTAIFSGMGMLILLQFITISLYPEDIGFDFLAFLLRTGPVLIVLLIIFEIVNWITDNLVPVNARAARKGTSKHAKVGYYPSSDSVTDDALKRGKLSLEESLRMQKSLGDYIKKRFVHEVTALDIDVVDSMKLKETESHENVIFSFSEYWKFVDGIVWEKQGRLLTRAGDGAIYLFKYPDYAVLASLDILKRLIRFNKSVNVLKNQFIVRIGLNTGRIVEDSSLSSSEVFSSVLDISAHLQKMAKPCGVFISLNTYDKLEKNKHLFEKFGYSERDNTEIYMLKEKYSPYKV